jgi:hypothetical protein
MADKAPQIAAEQTRLLFNGLHSSIAVSLLLAAAAVAYMQWPVIDQAVIIGWLAALLTVNLLRSVLAVGYFRVMPGAAQAGRWKLGFAACVGATGALWGLGAWMLYPTAFPTRPFSAC